MARRKPTTNQKRVFVATNRRGRRSRRKADFDVEAVKGGPGPADDFAGPALLTQQNEGAILKIADGTEKILGESGVVGVDATAGEFAFEFGVVSNTRTGARAEGFILKTVNKFLQSVDVRRGNYDTALIGVAIGDGVAVAKGVDAVEMAEKVENPRFGCGRGDEDARPDFGGVGAARRFTIFIRFGQFEADGANVRTEIERFYFEDVHDSDFKFQISDFKFQKIPRTARSIPDDPA